MDGIQLPSGYNLLLTTKSPGSPITHFILISLTSEGWKTESNLEQPSDFETGNPRLGTSALTITSLTILPIGQWNMKMNEFSYFLFNNVSFSQYLHFVFLMNPNVKIFNVIIDIIEYEKIQFQLLFMILGGIKMKFHQKLVQLRKIISKLLLTLSRRLETSSRLFYNFNKMTIQYLNFQ